MIGSVNVPGVSSPEFKKHTTNKENPHAVTKAQVGLENVDNTSDANKPVSTAQATAIAEAKKAGTDAQSGLSAHTGNKSNPHGVTAEQVGAHPNTWTPSADDVGADPKGTASSLIGTHNTDIAAHNDIRLFITDLTNRVNALANSDDVTLDQMAEVVAYIKNNKTLIDTITTSKVNVTDIVNDLVTNAANKPLSAAQGVTLKAMIDALTVDSALSETSTNPVQNKAVKAAIDQLNTNIGEKIADVVKEINHPVSSVNGMTGAVMLTADDVGAAAKCINVNHTGTDLDDYTEEGWYFFATPYKPNNIPAGSNGWLNVLYSVVGSVTYIKQIWHRMGTPGSNDYQTFVRTTASTLSGWGEWTMYATAKDSLSIKLLWTNASPSSEFAAQTVSLDLSGYDIIVVQAPNYRTRFAFCLIGMTSAVSETIDVFASYSGYTYGVERDFFCSTTGVEFGDCYYKAANSTSYQMKNERLVPYRIYGIKGVT